MLKCTLLALLAAVICHAATGVENYSMEFIGNRNRLFADGKEITFADCLKEQSAKYKEFKLRDLLKQAYQGAFGAGHAVLDRQKAWNYFSREFDTVKPEDIALFEIISPDYCRVNLGAWKMQIYQKSGFLICSLPLQKFFLTARRCLKAILKK